MSLQCPYCSSKDFVKRGTRAKIGGKTQLYICKQCRRTFTPSWTKNRQHSWRTILEAISYYNLGFSLEQVSQILKQKSEILNSKSETNSNDQNSKSKPSKAGIEISPSTIAAWVEQNREACAYSRMRSFAIKHFSPYEVVDTCTLAHRQLYRFRYHRAKIKYILEDDFKHYKFYPLKEFLDNVSGETPHQYFSEGLRASEAPIKFSKTEMIVRAKENYATKLAAFVFQGVSENKARHEALQRFFIANDSTTVATEVPVYIKKEDLAHMQTQLGFQLFKKVENPNSKSEMPTPSASRSCGMIAKQSNPKQIQNGENKNSKLNSPQPSLESREGVPQSDLGPSSSFPPLNLRGGEGEFSPMSVDEIPKLITGHIDFLQIRNGAIHILDYKGEGAAKARPIEQLALYALALSRLTGLRLFHFKCAWFDEKDYFEFFPLHCVYKPKRGRHKVYTKEGEYDINQRADKIEHLGPNWRREGRTPY